MQLTGEQLDAIRCGESVRFQESGTDLVVVRADLFERLRQELAKEGAWLDDALDPLAAENADLLGWEDIEFRLEEGESA
jgi:hypothetical protein